MPPAEQESALKAATKRVEQVFTTEPLPPEFGNLYRIVRDCYSEVFECRGKMEKHLAQCLAEKVAAEFGPILSDAMTRSLKEGAKTVFEEMLTEEDLDSYPFRERVK